MQKEVFDNIDILVSMADSSLTIDEANTELITLRENIKIKKNEIEDLKSQMVDARYFNASSELVDKNIEISLKNRINRLNRKIKDISLVIDETKLREKNLYNDITDLNEKIKTNKDYIKTLEDIIKDEENDSYYKELLTKERENEKALKEQLEAKKSTHEEILKELELNNLALKELNEELATEKSRLKDVLDNLNNPNAYFDEELKNSDEAKLKSLKDDLDRLEKRKLELLTDANIIAADAKELMIDNNIIDALNKVKELVTIVKAKPYMDISNPNIIADELEKKESLRLELSTLMDNKDYEDSDNNTIQKRIDYIKKATDNNQNTINSYIEVINNINEFVNTSVGVEINELEGMILKLEEKINRYHKLLKDKDKTPKNKANLESAIAKKEKEKNILNTILKAYKNNLLNNIDRIKKINGLINSLEEENKEFDKEIDSLKKLSLLDLKAKDLVEEEEDKEKIKTLNAEIKALKNRQKFTKTPDEIFDQIDMYLASAKEELLKDDTNKDENERLKVVEIIPITNMGGVK